MQETKALSSRGRGRLRGFLELRPPWGFSHQARRGSQGASGAAPGTSGLHGRGLFSFCLLLSCLCEPLKSLCFLLPTEETPQCVPSDSPPPALGCRGQASHARPRAVSCALRVWDFPSCTGSRAHLSLPGRRTPPKVRGQWPVLVPAKPWSREQVDTVLCSAASWAGQGGAVRELPAGG